MDGVSTLRITCSRTAPQNWVLSVLPTRSYRRNLGNVAVCGLLACRLVAWVLHEWGVRPTIDCATALGDVTHTQPHVLQRPSLDINLLEACCSRNSPSAMCGAVGSTTRGTHAGPRSRTTATWLAASTLSVHQLSQGHPRNSSP
jgi:hypothetical protein